MDGIRKYSKEWFTLQGKNGEEYRNSVSGLETGVNSSLKTNGTSLSKSIFTGSKEEVLENYSNHVKSIKGMPSTTMMNVQKYGLDNIFEALDANNDGVVSEEEIQDVAALDTKEFANKDDETFSTDDLEILYQNAMESVNSSFVDKGLVKEFQYENGDVTRINYDKGNLSSKYVETANEDGTKTGVSYYYSSKSTSTKEFDEEGRITSSVYNSPDKTQNTETTTVYNDDGSKTVQTKTYLTTSTNLYDENNKIVSSEKEYNYDINGKIEDTAQASIGDCWVLAGTNSLRTSAYGRAMISEAIKQNDDGSVTVTLKGVNKTYTYSPKEIIDNEYSDPGKSYSKGDTDMNLIEMAIGDYRRELIASGDYEKNGRDLSKTAGKDATVEDPLKGGQIDEAIYYLTGLKSEFVYNNIDATKDMIETYSQSTNKYIMNCTFNEKDSSIGSITTAHAYSITGVDEENVYVVNPWDSSVEIAYPKEKFFENAKQVTLTDLTPGKREHYISAPSDNITLIDGKSEDKSFSSGVKKLFKKIFS